MIQSRPIGRSVREIVFVGMSMFATATAVGSQAFAEEALGKNSWEKLADGRIAILVRDATFVLPASGIETQDIKFYLYPSSRYITLQKVIDDRAAAIDFFNSGENVRLSIPAVSAVGGHRPNDFLGHFDRADYSGSSLSISMGPGIQGNCRAWAADYERLSKQHKSELLESDSSTWMEIKIADHPERAVYLHTAPLSGAPKYFDNVSCGLGNSCSISSCIDEDKAISYRFGKPKNASVALKTPIENAMKLVKFVWPEKASQWKDGK